MGYEKVYNLSSIVSFQIDWLDYCDEIKEDRYDIAAYTTFGEKITLVYSLTLEQAQAQLALFENAINEGKKTIRL